MKVKNFARPGVNNARFRFRMAGATRERFLSLGQNTWSRPFRFWVCIFLTGAIWIGNINVSMQPLFDLAPVGKLHSPVTGNVLNQGRRKGRHRQNNGVFHDLRALAKASSPQYKSGSCARPKSQVSFDLALSAYYGVCFPVSSSLAAVYRLVPLGA